MSAAQKLPFTIREEAGYIIFQLPAFLGVDDTQEFTSQAEALIQNAARDVIVDCTDILELPQTWIRALLSLSKMLKTANKNLRLVHVRSNIKRLLKTEGLSQTIKTLDSLKEALTEIGHQPTVSLNVKFINPFLAATIHVLSTQASTTAKPGPIYRKSAGDKFHGDISGVIGLVSDTFCGSVAICFPAATFLGVMSRMLGETLIEMNKELEDGAGELTNIIFGQAKIELNNLGYGIKTALPSVVTGTNHSIAQVGSSPRVVIPFETDVGAFFVEISISE